jgi:hypothetical protein
MTEHVVDTRPRHTYCAQVPTTTAWLGHVSIGATNIHAEVDLETKARTLAACQSFTPDTVPAKRWRDVPSLSEAALPARVPGAPCSLGDARGGMDDRHRGGSGEAAGRLTRFARPSLAKLGASRLSHKGSSSGRAKGNAEWLKQCRVSFEGGVTSHS